MQYGVVVSSSFWGPVSAVGSWLSVPKKDPQSIIHNPTHNVVSRGALQESSFETHGESFCEFATALQRAMSLRLAWSDYFIRHAALCRLMNRYLNGYPAFPYAGLRRCRPSPVNVAWGSRYKTVDPRISTAAEMNETESGLEK